MEQRQEHRQEHLLAIRLKTCGRFLYYQIGGKAGQQRILMTLLFRERMTQKQLQDLLGISSGAMSEILQKMEDAGLIQRSKCAKDKRQVDLLLSESGKEFALQVKAHYHQTLERMFECLGAEQKDQLESILGVLVQHLDALKADPLFAQAAEAACGAAPR